MSLYLDIAEKFKKSIKLGKLKAGDRIPNELELAERLGHSRKTIRTVLALLESDGLIIRRQKSGTVVTPDAAERVRITLRFGIACPYSCDTDDLPVVTGKLDAASQLLRRLFQEGAELRMIATDVSEIPGDLDGVILRTPTQVRSLQEKLAVLRIPHIGFDVFPEIPGSCTVVADDEEAARKCVRDLVDHGFRQIAFLGGALLAPEIRSGVRRRTESFLAECARLGVAVPEERIFNIPDHGPQYGELLENFAQRIDNCDAIVCSMGQQVLELERLRRICGERFFPRLEVRAVDLTPYDHPELWASLRRFRGFCKPHEQLSKIAFELLMRFMSDEEFTPCEYKIPFRENIPES